MSHRENERLKERVKDLQDELLWYKSQESVCQTAYPSPATQHSQKLNGNETAVQMRWEGIEVGTARSPNASWYGASSLFYFIGRMNKYLSSTLIETQDTDQIVLHNTTNTLLEGSNNINLNLANPGHQSGARRIDEFLSPTQEEYFIDLFWKSYHTSLFPIIHETEFMDHYRSLWSETGDSRRPCALVDIVIALCMQYGASTLATVRQQPFIEGDTRIAGRWYYRRSQCIVSYQLESPTIWTVQCLCLTAIYLCNGSFQNMSADACGAAVRAAYTAGLHIDPPATMHESERQLRRRLWWALYELDSKVGMKLGRPFSTQRALNEPKLPDDNPEAALQSGSRFTPLGEIRHGLLFIMTVPPDQTMYDDPAALESQAQEAGWQPPYSIDASRLEIEQFAPQWLQRQRINLELIYHTVCINLYRPFICFIPPEMKRRLPRQLAQKSALHAITHTNIMHQVLTTTTILTGWHEAFQWQWNASMTFVGFTLACPAGALACDAVGVIDMSIAIFDKFGEYFTVAKSAAGILRGIKPKVNLRLQSYAEAQNTFECEGVGGATQANLSDAENASMNRSMPASGASAQLFDSLMTDAPLEFDLSDMPSMQEMFQSAYSIEQWTDLGDLMPDVGGNMDNL
ncbi:hypothetical protein N7470_008123, partial [Penicillium chermesinum]